jgi:hypothetical protein
MPTRKPYRESPAEARRLWSAALRSGEYSRCRTFLMLKMPDGERRYSSFGVACELFRQRYPELLQRTDVVLVATQYHCAEYVTSEGCERFHLPTLVCRWLGLTDCVGTLHNDFAYMGYGTLGEWEDVEVESFAQVADLIDASGLRTEDAAVTN